MNTKSKNLGAGWVAFILILMIAIVILAGLWAPKGLNWVIVAGSMLVFVISLGLHICGRPMGILIDERNGDGSFTIPACNMDAYYLVLLQFSCKDS